MANHFGNIIVLAEPAAATSPVDIVEVPTMPLNIDMHTTEESGKGARMLFSRFLGPMALVDSFVQRYVTSKNFMGPGSHGGMCLRVAEFLLMLLGIIASTLAHSFSKFTNYRLLRIALILHLVWSMACFVYDIYSKRNSITQNFSRMLGLLMGYMVFGNFLLMTIVCAVVNTVSVVVDERKYSMQSRLVKVIVTTIVFSFLGWLCSLVSCAKLSCIFSSILFSDVEWIREWVG